MNKSKTYQYLRIGSEDRQYFCLQQNPFVLAWLLYFKKDTLNLIFTPWCKSAPSGWNLGWLRELCHLFVNNLKTLIYFVRRQCKVSPNDSVVHLPLYGQLCIPVHRGYKIFDLHQGIVAKVFDHDVHSSSIGDEIERLKNVSQVDFAPSLKRWDIEEKWYEEDYVSSTSNESSQGLVNSEKFLNRFCKDVAPCLERLILLKKPMAKKLVEYIHETTRILEISRMSRCNENITEYAKIRNFLDFMSQRLCVEGNGPIQLVFTHGDFCPANMLDTKNGMRLLDWEGAKYRSALFDFYSYVFYRPVSLKMPVMNLRSEINQSLPLVLSKLDKAAPDISRCLRNSENVYRWMYYIEQVCGEVEREMTDKNLPILEYILDYIETFQQYEMLLSNNVE